MLNGYIKMHRKFAEWEWYKEPCTKDVFIHLLIMASYKDISWKGVALKPGQVIVGRKALAEAIGWSEQNVSTALKHLEKTQEITINPTNKYSIVTIEKWEKYQLECEEDNQQTNQQLTNNQPTTNQQLTTSKEYKEYKNNIYSASDGIPNDNQAVYQMDTQDRLGKNSINNNSASDDARELFERLWKLYPRKKGKSQVSLTTKKKLLKVGEEIMTKAIERYSREVEGKEEQYILMGSTFFNGRYQDYLEEVNEVKKNKYGY